MRRHRTHDSATTSFATELNTMNNPDPPEDSASKAGTADGVNTTAMPAPSPEVAQYIHGLIYQIPEIRQSVEAQGAAIQQHNDILGHTQAKYNELAAQLSEVAKRITRLVEREEGEMSEHSGASPPKTSTLAKDVQGLQQEIQKMRGELSDLQSKAVKYERGLVTRGTVDLNAAQLQGLPVRPKLPAATTATGSEIPTAPASMRQQNHPRPSQDVDAMNNKLKGLIEEIKNLKKERNKPSQSQKQSATVPGKSPTSQNTQLVKHNDNNQLVLRGRNARAQPMSTADEEIRSEFVSSCRQRILFKGKQAIEELSKRYDYELGINGAGSAGMHPSRTNNPNLFPRRAFAETERLNINMNYWNGRVVNALDQAAMKGREQAAVNVVKNLVHQMERYRGGDNSVADQITKFEVNYEGIAIIKSWFKWTDELFKKLRSLGLFEVPGVASTAVSRAIDEGVKNQLAQKRLLGSPPSHHDSAKRHVPGSFNSSNKRRAVSPANHNNAKRHAPGVFSSPIKRRAASPPSSPYSVDSTRRPGADIFRSVDKRRALSPLSDAEIARRHADSFLKNLDLQEASSTHHPAGQYRSPRGEPHRAPEYHRDGRDYYGPGTNIRSDFYPDMPIQERRFRRGDYM
ncbi:uncharacterized protein J3D65DRAFT_677759 [Phyllosticta citribraziliensis]|uniref:Uncharacterized protein n=1 Tax=Phyllosticta citribraziliensis TaxID=989973 RepID=A0ABR1LLC8_9PEZI